MKQKIDLQHLHIKIICNFEKLSADLCMLLPNDIEKKFLLSVKMSLEKKRIRFTKGRLFLEKTLSK
ncbi:hypothetical protein BpHYR1_004919 [Brachionus plicatilis]|uniref:Uncharacterized protein n=1 Tax=Brachionus plicatilis TaxID=10195 RepID=A0A3M7QZ82_BRAPC|nr:hypothetical protein BpHYR1_004919 [Brachionus plicatilis]